MKYEVVMGLEVHLELLCKSKLFCSCPVNFNARPNENICPSCAGMPGIPPVLNEHAIKLGIIAGLVTNCKIATVTSFDKKNYFYPDLPTGYQVTQYFAPICTGGYIDLNTSQGPNRINIKQIHIEEDAGKLVHEGHSSYLDFNRAGVPLVEIVSNPDFRTSEEVIAYLEKLKSLMSFAEVSNCKLQEGSMRCDVNISVREQGATEYGTRTEIKNMSSFKSILSAIEYESQRHIDILETNSNTLIQETRGWDESKGETYSLREKENADDYRYFPNPEIMSYSISSELVDSLRNSLSETAEHKYLRMTKELGLSSDDSKLITSSKTLSDIFDKSLAVVNNPKEVTSWIVVELLSIPRGENKSVDDITIDVKKFADLISLVDKKTINRTVAKKILVQLVEDDVDPIEYVKEHNLGMVSDTVHIGEVIDSILSINQNAVNEYISGNQKVVGFLVGQIMKTLGGKADPKVVNQLLSERLSLLT